MTSKRLAFDPQDKDHVEFHNMVHAASSKRGKPFTEQEAKELFASFESADFMVNDNPDDGCTSRRSLVQILLIERGVSVSTARFTFSEKHPWTHHEAAAFKTDDSDETWVLDTGMRDNLESLDEWKTFINNEEDHITGFELIEDDQPHFTLKGAMKRLERLMPYEESAPTSFDGSSLGLPGNDVY